MQARRDATLNLSSLLHHSPGSDIEVEADGLLVPTDDLLTADGLSLAGPLEWNVRVFNTGGDDDFIVDGSVSGVAVLDCRRCLSPVEVDVEAEFIYPMLYRPSDLPMALDELDDDEEERLVFGSPQVDFAPLLTQLFAIEVPLTALCKPDCLGLDEDGVNLNEYPERAAAAAAAAAAARTVSSPPSPFAGLEEVLKDIDITS